MVDEETKKKLNYKQLISLILFVSVIILLLKFYMIDYNKPDLKLPFENISNKTNNSIILNNESVIYNVSIENISNIINKTNITNIMNLSNISNLTVMSNITNLTNNS